MLTIDIRGGYVKFLDIHIRNVMPKFESSRFNSVAVITKTYAATYIHTYTHTAELR